jgi:hypothetical protein
LHASGAVLVARRKPDLASRTGIEGGNPEADHEIGP